MAGHAVLCPRASVSIRAPRVGGDIKLTVGAKCHVVSIRAPRVGGDERFR